MKKDKDGNYIESCKTIGKTESCGYEIDYFYENGKKRAISQDAKNYVKSNELVEALLKDEYNGKKIELYVTNESDRGKWFNEKGSRQNNGRIKIDQTQGVRSFVWNGKYVEKEKEEHIPITLGHEMIHFYHKIYDTEEMIKKLPKVGEHYELGYNGRPINDTWLIETKEGNFEKASFGDLREKGWVEEYRTVGIGGKTADDAKKSTGPSLDGKGKYNLDGDITENMLRIEHKLRLRGVYRNEY